MRGMLHQYAFVAALAVAPALLVGSHGLRARLAAVAFATSVATMFGASALYHRVSWSPRRRRWLRRLDHATIYLLIAGTYTPVGLLVLSGTWRIVVLAVVWSGAGVAMTLKLAWVDAPKWVAATIASVLGWVGVIVFPQLLDRIGIGGMMLLLAGGIFYSVGALVYARRRPDPIPSIFGYHELFHTLVIVAVALQYISIAFFVLQIG